MEKKQKTLGNKGFSLVELIIVIAIMAVLVVVLAPQFIKFVEKGRESTDLQNVTEMKTAVETYAADHMLAGATPITITITGGAGGKAALGGTGFTSGDLKEYGVEDEKALQSESWTGITFTYNGSATTAYQWTASPAADTVGATYYMWDGSEAP